MKKYTICVIYVDDAILTGFDAKAPGRLIKTLSIAEDIQCHSFKLNDEGEVGKLRVSRLKRQVPRSLLWHKLS